MAKKGYIKEGLVVSLAVFSGLAGIMSIAFAAGAITTKIKADNYREELYANEFFQETKALDISTASESFEESKKAYKEGTLSAADIYEIKIEYDDKISYINSDSYMADYYDYTLDWNDTSKNVHEHLDAYSRAIETFTIISAESALFSIAFGVLSGILGKEAQKEEDAERQKTIKELAK